MLVTEGKASGRDRTFCLAAAASVLAAAAAIFALLPPAVAPALWASVFIGVTVSARHLVFSIFSRFVRPRPRGEQARRPSFAFIIPSLNERASLERTLPAMAELAYQGTLCLCYVCEKASTDGTADYVRQWAARDERVVCIEKQTPPAGRGAAISYGIEHAPRCDVVAFLDADHVLGQESLEELARIFGQAEPPDVVQGACESANEDRNALTRLLSIERRWMERVEVDVSPRLGGVAHFGGGQGFFRRELFDDERFAIDGSMILDDTDLSCRLALEGRRVEFHPSVATWSLQPETWPEFLDQRFRWSRGLLQISHKYLGEAIRRKGAPFALRMDILRLTLLPYGGLVVYASLAAAVLALLTGRPADLPGWLAPLCLAWPLVVGLQPPLAGVRPRRLGDVALSLVGIPLLFLGYAMLFTVSLVDAYVLRRPIRYAKTSKD